MESEENSFVLTTCSYYAGINPAKMEVTHEEGFHAAAIWSINTKLSWRQKFDAIRFILFPQERKFL